MIFTAGGTGRGIVRTQIKEKSYIKQLSEKDRGDRCYTMRVSLGKRFLLGTLGAPAGVLGSGVEGPRRNQLLIAQIMKILEEKLQISQK